MRLHVEACVVLLLELLGLPLLLVWSRQNLASWREQGVVLRSLPLKLLELRLQVWFACLLRAALMAVI